MSINNCPDRVHYQLLCVQSTLPNPHCLVLPMSKSSVELLDAAGGVATFFPPSVS